MDISYLKNQKKLNALKVKKNSIHEEIKSLELNFYAWLQEKLGNTSVCNIQGNFVIIVDDIFTYTYHVDNKKLCMKTALRGDILTISRPCYLANATPEGFVFKTIYEGDKNAKTFSLFYDLLTDDMIKCGNISTEIKKYLKINWKEKRTRYQKLHEECYILQEEQKDNIKQFFKQFTRETLSKYCKKQITISESDIIKLDYGDAISIKFKKETEKIYFIETTCKSGKKIEKRYYKKGFSINNLIQLK